MAGKRKGPKTKSKDQPQAPTKEQDKVKRREKGPKTAQQPWLDDLGQALANAGLHIRTVGADGNCFFRACCDQMQGNELDHMELRKEVVDFMREHPDDFAPYIEDDEDFSSYCSRMSKEGAWAGLHEQVALTRLKAVALCIHQAGQPCWTVRPDFPEIPKDAPSLHLSYHDGEHYNSVRLAEDRDYEPALPIILAEGGSITKPQQQVGSKWGQQKIDAVRWGTGCEDVARIQAGLESAQGDTDATIEALVEEVAQKAAGSPQDTSDQPHCPSNAIQLPDVAESSQLQTGMAISSATLHPGIIEETDAFRQPNEGRKEKGLAGHEISREKGSLKDRPPAKRRACICGSGKKYKNCCGIAKSAAARRHKAEQDKIFVSQADVSVPLSNLYI